MVNNKKKEQYLKIAKMILAAVGDRSNITSVTHCMTRLRFNLKDESLPIDSEVQNIPGVIGVNRAGGQYQVIIGQTVDKVYDALTTVGNLTQNTPIDENLDDNLNKKLTWKSIGNSVLNKLAGCLTPLIPMLIAASMFKMFAAILGPSMLNLVGTSSDLYKLFVLVGDAGFYFFPIVLGYTAAKQFNTSPIVSMFLGGILIDPNLIKIVTAGKAFAVFGIPMNLVNYSSTVIPIILSIWVMSYIEHFFKNHITESLGTILVPTLTIIVMLPIALCVLGPAGAFLGNYICEGILAFGKLGGLPTILAIGVVAAIWEILVITGMHLLMITTMMMVFAQAGHENFVTLGAVAASLSVAGMCLGAALRLKDKDQKTLAWSYLIASIIGGVTEPALYGLAIRYKRPFIGMMIGGFLGGLYAGVTQITAYVMVPVANFLALTAYVGGNTANIINGIISGIVAFIAAAVATYIIGVEPKPQETTTSEIKLVEA
ncbi:PTS transporter subunit EIIC [Liquorilactobacillus mali]|uniref:PTS transporter subunit EIIC n=1 Tax=Liquorilactobacillus mali TaxID=1618 RepID=UPI0029544046|nr:PTS transporter subunit EIIC [Liquorilactobacillus mali]MDV7757528.1 PTS fructose transporter subunit IIB [Liquorilactobacillus mali]